MQTKRNGCTCPLYRGVVRSVVRIVHPFGQHPCRPKSRRYITHPELSRMLCFLFHSPYRPTSDVTCLFAFCCRRSLSGTAQKVHKASGSLLRRRSSFLDRLLRKRQVLAISRSFQVTQQPVLCVSSARLCMPAPMQELEWCTESLVLALLVLVLHASGRVSLLRSLRLPRGEAVYLLLAPTPTIPSSSPATSSLTTAATMFQRIVHVALLAEATRRCR